MTRILPETVMKIMTRKVRVPTANSPGGRKKKFELVLGVEVLKTSKTISDSPVFSVEEVGAVLTKSGYRGCK